MDITRILKKYYEQLHTHKFNNLDEMNQFLKKQPAKTHIRRNRQSKES